jgi:hypothetical protein
MKEHKQSNLFRQGDVLIERIESIPESATKQPPSDRIILALGEVTGHHHCLCLPEPADWWKTDETKPSTTGLAGEIFFDLAAPAEITHQEHAKIALAPGKYRVTRQREYAPGAIRNVAD